MANRSQQVQMNTFGLTNAKRNETVRLWYEPVVGGLPAPGETPPNGLGLFRATSWSMNSRDGTVLEASENGWYWPDFVVSLEVDGRTAWAIVDSKYSTINTVIRYYGVSQVFKYLENGWYWPDFVVSLEVDGRTAWAIVDSKYSTINTVIRYYGVSQVFKYLMSLRYWPDFVVSLEVDGRTAWAIVDSKYSTINTVIRYYGVSQVFKYLMSLRPIKAEDVFAGLWLWCGSVTPDTSPEGSFFDVAQSGGIPMTPDLTLRRLNGLTTDANSMVSEIVERLRQVI